MTEKKYNALDPVLREITSKCITLSDHDKKKYNEIFTQVLENIIDKMKQVDDVFECLYQKPMYTGSFYENLRINKPDEFDINLIFIFPASLKVIYSPKQPGFVTLEVMELDNEKVKKLASKSINLEKCLKSWCQNGRLLVSSFMHWMQGVFNKAISNLLLPNLKVKPSASGPALTIIVEDPPLSIDLVPVLQFTKEYWPLEHVRQCPEGAPNDHWFVVPKEPEGVKDGTFWRMSFYNQEKEIMHGFHSLKHVIKLLKLLRDKHKWKFLSSYAIKTLFLWELEQHPQKSFWQNGIGFLFMYMLTKLSEYSKSKSIPFFWDKNLNLLKTNEETLKIMHNRLEIILTKVDKYIEDNPQHILKYFYLPKDSTTFSTDEVRKTNEDQSLRNCPPANNFANDIISTQEASKSKSNTCTKNSNCQSSPIYPVDEHILRDQDLAVLEQKVSQRFESLTQEIEALKCMVKELQKENFFMKKKLLDLENQDKNINTSDFTHSLIDFDTLVPSENPSQSAMENINLIQFDL